jgi:hypothetical protein
MKSPQGGIVINNFVKRLACISIALFSLQSFAENTIKITVQTDEKRAAGIGYSVAGKKLGTLGKSYSGKGPINQKYVFGYRQDSFRGANITCGELTLTKDTTITLVTQGNECLSVVSNK